MNTIVNSYFVPKSDVPEQLILIISLFLIIGVWSIILYFATKNSKFQSDANVKAYEVCPLGSCPTDRFTGQKRCPKNPNQPIQYNPILEVCNPINACTDQTTPYAVQTDGSVNVAGQCGVNNNGCRCVNFIQSPSYTQVIFNMTNGNLYSNIDAKLQGRLTFTQTPTQYVGEGNNVSQVYTDFTTQFYEISPSLLGYVSPNPCSVEYSGVGGTVGEVNTETQSKCINLNPCLSGRLAYVPGTAIAFQSFTDANLNNTPLACVPNSVSKSTVPDPKYLNSCRTDLSSPDPYYYVPVFDSSSGLIVCHRTNLQITS
jgi:hypothetical protein